MKLKKESNKKVMKMKSFKKGATLTAVFIVVSYLTFVLDGFLELTSIDNSVIYASVIGLTATVIVGVVMVLNRLDNIFSHLIDKKDNDGKK